jgi:hypothetical protein
MLTGVNMIAGHTAVWGWKGKGMTKWNGTIAQGEM